jgi:tetratricopeptide (TPR) repeat protein
VQNLKSDQEFLTQHAFTSGLHLADWWRLQGRWDDAASLLGGLLPAALELGDEALAQFWTARGRILMEKGMFKGVDTSSEQEDAFGRALKYAETAGETVLLGDIWDTKGMAVHAAFLEADDTDEPQEEMQYFQRGLDYHQQAADKRGIASSTFHVGVVYGVVRRDHATAQPYFEQAYQLALEAMDLELASYALRHIAFARHDAGELEAAREDLRESLRLREEVGFIPGTAFALMALARIEAELGDHATALRLLERAKSILESLEATSRVAWVEQAMARL